MTPWLGVVVSFGLCLGRDCGPAGPSSTMKASAPFPGNSAPEFPSGPLSTSHSRCAVGLRHAETAQSSGFSTYSDDRRSSRSKPASISSVQVSISRRVQTFSRTSLSA